MEAQARLDEVESAAIPTVRPRVRPLVALATLGYLLVAAPVWYFLHGSSNAVVGVWCGGVAVFYAAVWLDRGVAPWRLRLETQVVTLSMLAFLTLFWFYGRRGNYADWFGADPPVGGLRGLIPYFFFVACSVVARIALPLITGRLALRRGAADYGYRLRGTFRLAWVYLALFLIIVPVVVFYASKRADFLRAYPWCRSGIDGGHVMQVGVFAIYAPAALLFYGSGEAFWRGWLLFGTERELGDDALFLMLIPYVCGHFGKPLPETLGAIASGLVLGFLALRHRSFWLGALTHWGVAMTMDLAALWRKGVHFVGP
jgi:hypothetical protein